MKKLFFVFLIMSSLLLASCVDTEITLSGKVTDKTDGSPIANATVSDGNYGNGNMGITGADGEFSYVTYCEEHTIEISAEGYKSLKKTLMTPWIATTKEITIQIELERE
jgi:hypothetical protein